MIRRLYDWMMGLAENPKATQWLAVISFAESSFFPIPPDVMLIPMVLARRAAAFFNAAICTVSSVAGGMAGYAIGYFLLDALGMPILRAYGLEAKYGDFVQAFDEWGLWIILIKGLTPIPYKLVTIASGAAKFDLLVFALASIATRGLRFFMVAGLLWWIGEPIRTFVEKYLTLVTTVFVICLVGGFVVVKYLV